MVANPNRPARTEEEKAEEQFKEKRLRQRIDRYLESQGLLKYQTKGMSQAQVAQKFAEAGVKLRASELVNYKPTQTTTQTTTQPTLAPQKQTSGFYYAKGKKSFSPTSLRINTSDVKTVITTPQTTISDTAASEPFFKPKSSLVIPPSEIDRKLKEYAEVALEYKKYRIPFGTKSDLAEEALKEDTALVAFGNMVTREGEVTRVVTDSQAIRDRARLEIAYDNDIKAGKMWAPMKAVKLAWYDISNLGALDNFGIVQDLKNFITDENSYGQIFNAAFRAGQFILEGDISQVNRVLISYTGSPLQVMNMSTEEKIDMLTTEVLDDYKTKLEDYTNKYEKSSGLQKVGYWAAKQWYGWVVDDIIDTETSYRGMNTAWELFKNVPRSSAPVYVDAYKEHVARMKEIKETESEQAKNRIPVIENQVSALRAQLGQSEEQDAIVSEQMIELTIEKQTLVDALNNTYSEYGAYTWSGEPEKYLEFRRNLAIAELQKGAPLTRREIWRIKSLSANPAAEGFGEFIFDITNLAGFASKVISAPIKSSKIYITATAKIDDVTKTVLKTADNFLKTAGPKIPLSGATAKFFGRTSVTVLGLAYSSAKVLTSPVRRLFRPAVRTVANKRRDLLFNILGSVAKSFDSTDKFGETLGDISRYLSMANSAKDAAAIEKVYQTMITTVPGTAGITFNQFLELRSLVDDAAYGIDPKNLDWTETYIESANKAKEQLKQVITNRLTDNGKKPTTLSIIREVDESFFRQSTPSALINVIGDFSKKFEDSYIDAFRSTMNAGWFGRKTALTTDTLLGRMALGLYMLGGDVTSRQAQAILNYTMDESLNWGKALRREVARFSTGFSKRNAVNLANLLSNVDYVFNIVRSLWINAILTLNPRYYLSNYIDNTFRTISYGGNPFQDVELMYRSLPSDIVESALRSPLDLTPEAIRARQLGTVPIEIGQGLARTDISFSESIPSKLMYQGWKPRFGIFSFWNEEYRRLAGVAREQATTEVMKGIQRGGVSEKVRKVVESTSLLWKSLINGSTDFNTAIEFSFRLRIFHNQYFKELSRAAPIYTNEVVKGLSKNLSDTGKLIYENSVDPNEILAKVDDMTDPKNARPSSWFSAISQETLDLMKGLSQSEKVVVMTAIRRNMVDYFTELGKAGQKVEPKHIDEFVDSMMDELRVIMSMYQSEADRLKNINTALQTHPTDINLNPPTDIVDDLTGGAPSSAVPTEVKPAKPSRAQKVFDAKLDRIMEDGISLKKVSGEDFAVVKNDDGSFTVEIGENAKPQTIKDALSSLLYSSNETYISKTLGLSRSEFLDMVQSMVKNPVEFESKNSDLFYDLSRMIDNNIGDNLIGSDNRVKINLLREDPNYTAIQLESDGFEDAEARMGFMHTLTEEKQIAGRNAAVANVNMMNRVKGVTNPELSAEMVRFNENQSLMHSSLLSFYREVYPLQRNSYSAAKMEKYHRLTTQLYIREAGLRNKFEKMLANEDEALRIISEFNDDYITNWLKEVGFTDFKFDLQAPSVRSGETEPFQILTSFSMMDDAGKKVTRNGSGLYSDITTRFQRYMYSAKNLQQVKFNVVMKFDASGVDNALADAVRVAFNLDNKTAKTASKFLKNYAEWKLRMRGLDVTTENIVNALKTDLQFSRLNFTPSGAQFYEMRNAPGVNAFTFIGTGSQNVEGFVKQLAELYVGELSKISSAKAGEASLAARRNASQQLQAIKNAVSQATGKPFIGTVTPSAKELTKETAENIAVLRQLFTNYIFSGETGNKKFARVFKQMRQFLAKQFKDTSPAELRSIINTGRFATDAMPDDLYAIMDNLIMGHNADNFDESGSKVRLLRTLAKNRGWNFKTDEQLLQLINNHATVLSVTPAVQRRFIDAMLAAGRKRDEAEMAFEVMQTAARRWGAVRNQPADEFFTTLFVKGQISGDDVAGLLQSGAGEIEAEYAKDLISNSLTRILQIESTDPDLHRIYTDIIAAPIYRGPNIPFRPYNASSESVMMRAKVAVLNQDENASALLKEYVDMLERDGALPVFIEQFEQYIRYRITEINLSLRSLGLPTVTVNVGNKSLQDIGSALEFLDKYEKVITDSWAAASAGFLESKSRGKYWRTATERFIELGDKADATTFFHEFWHDYVYDLTALSADYKKTANSAFKFASEDLAKLEDYTGLKQGELITLRPVFDDYRILSAKKASGKITKKQAERLDSIAKDAKRYEAAQEKIANAGLKYMASGKVETPELKGMFERLAKWLKGVWTEINSLIGDSIPKEVARVFERAFAPVSYTKLPERYSSLADVDLDAFRLTLGEEAEARAIEELNFAFDVWKQQEGALRGFPAEHLESPSKFASYLKMRLAESERAEAETYRTLLFKLEHLMDEVGAMADPNYVKIGNVVPPKSIVPPELLSVTKVKEDNIRILESLLPTMEGVRKDMHRRLITGEFIPNLTAEEAKELKEWAKVAAKYKADMNEAITYGGILKGADGQILFRSEGALPATNDIMIDYSTRNNFDNLMRGVFPFWMFPSRSIPFWLKTIATHPGYLSMYLNVQRASQAYRYQHGAVDRNGRPVQSLRGFIPLGNTGLWVNPYQQTSAKYVLDLIAYAGEMVRGDLYDSSEDVGPATQVLSTLVENGPLLGLHPAPWMKFLFQAGVPGFPKDSFATFPLAPQLGLVPRHHLAYIFNLTPTTRSFFDKWVYPEVSWRDTDIERILLEQYLEDEASGKFETDEDLEKARKEVEAAIIEKGTNPIWNEAVKEYDDRRADVNRLSFFTGVYLKSYSDGKAQIYETKNYVETLKWAVNDPFMTANMGLPVDPIARDEFLNAARFETSDAWLYNIYDRTGWVRSESGKVLTDPAERNSRLSELLQNDAKLESLYAEAAYAKRDAEIKLSKLPIGAYGTPEYNEIQGDYLRRINEIYNSIPPRDYYGREGTSEGLELKLRNDWWRRIQATMPVWDMRNEDYNDYEKRVDAWKRTLPELAKYMSIPETTGAPDDRGEFSSFMARYKQVQKFVRKNQSLDPNLIQKLIEETTAQGYDEWRRSNDDLTTALNEVYRLEYINKYYDASEGLPTFASKLATEQWLEQNPEPTIEKFTAWLGKYYPGRFTQKDVENLFANIDSLDKVYSVSERKDAKSSDYEKKKQEIWEILWMAGPNKQKKFLFTDEFTDSRTGLPNASDYLTAWYFSNGKLWDNGNRDSQAQFEAFYQAVTKLAKEQGIDQPTMADLQQFAEAESLNLEFTALVTDRLGEKFLSNYDENQAGVLGEYLSMDKAGRRQFRNENPEEYKLVQTYYDMRDEFAAMNPLWSQFYVKYDPDFDPNSTTPVPGAGSPTSSGGASYGGGGGQRRGGRRGRRGGGGGGGAPAPSTGGTLSIQWPDGIINFLSSTIMQEISAYFASGTPLSASTIQYLRNLAQNHPEWADFINQIING